MSEVCSCDGEDTHLGSTSEEKWENHFMNFYKKYDESKATKEHVRKLMRKFSKKTSSHPHAYGNALFLLMKKYGMKDVAYEPTQSEL